MPAPRLFVSHSSLDSAFAKQLVADLRSRLGDDDAVWMDELGGIHGGDKWWRKIVAEITARDFFLVVLTPRALASEWVQEEMEIAHFQSKKVGKKLRPVLLEACTLTTDWELIHSINFTGGAATYAAKLDELLATITQESAAQPLPQPARQRSPTSARLIEDVQTAFGLQDWRAVEDKTDLLAERDAAAMSAALWQRRGLALLALDNPALALDALDHALGIDQDDVSILQNKGAALLALNRLEEATDAFRRAYRLAPLADTPLRLRALSDLVRMLMRAEQWTEAERRAEDGVRLAPDDDAWQQRLQMVRLAPVQASLQARYETAMQAQHWDEAHVICAEALNLAPDSTAWQRCQAQIDQAQMEAERRAEAQRQAQAQRAATRERLTDGSYLQEQIRQRGAEAVADAIAQAGQDDETLRALAAAIRAGTAVLKQAPEEVWNQAMGRAGLTLAASHPRQMPRFDLRFATLPPLSVLVITCKNCGQPTMANKPFCLNCGASLAAQGHTATVYGCAFSPNGSLALSASYDQTLRLWNVATGQVVRLLEGHTNNVAGCAFSPDGSLALSASADDALRLWNVATGQTVRVLEGHTNYVSSCAFSPDGSLALSASADNALRLWHVASGKPLNVLKGHTGPIWGCAYSPGGDGKLVLSASADNALRLWNVATGQTIRVLQGHTKGVYGCAFSPDGALALSASYDKTLRLWNVASGQTERELKGHTTTVWGCAFSPDGTLALSASADNTLRLWNVANGSELCRWTTDVPLLCCAFGPDGKTVIAGDDRGGVHFLSLVR